jgi:peroxiredoxin
MMNRSDAAVADIWSLGGSERAGKEVLSMAQHYHSAHVTHPPTPLPAGTPAPDFALHSTPDQKISLADFRGRPVVLAFYPADWSPVCSDQMALYNELLPEFRRYKAQVVGISVDGAWSHAAFSKDRNLHFPLLADFEPKGAVSNAYGAYQRRIGESARALFVIDGNGIIRWSYLSPVGVNPGADGILEALEAMQGEDTKAATPKESNS